MVVVEDKVIMADLLRHIANERQRAELVNKPFELGVLTDKRPSQIFKVLRAQENQDLLQEIGMTDYRWSPDALRSTISLAGENLIISICSPR